jgi:hypothetical protein
MDFFDECVLAAPKDGKPRGFTARGATAKKQKRTARLKLPPNQKIRIITILHQFRDKPARANLWWAYWL